MGSDVLGSRAYAEELADREAEEAAAQAAETEAEEAAEPELDEYGIAIEGADHEASLTEDAAAPAPVEPRTARVLEVGCGTGCISLSLAWERRGHVTCTATDIEPRAIDLATKNRDALGLTSDEVAFSLTNLVSSIPREEWGTFDVLVSNPPYIPTDVMRSLPHEVKDFEPDLALEGGADGLDIFRRLLNAAPYMLRAGGLFACRALRGRPRRRRRALPPGGSLGRAHRPRPHRSSPYRSSHRHRAQTAPVIFINWLAKIIK